MKTATLIRGTFKRIFSGGKLFLVWIHLLLILALLGLWAYAHQLSEGLIATAMRDQVPWGLYISNFTFLIGIAAAAVLLVIPAYVYGFKDIKEIVLLGEILAVCAVVMAMMFVTVDLGRIDRFWHLILGVGILNIPSSVLAWDIMVLSGYLLLNFIISFYMLYKIYMGEEPNWKLIIPLIIVSIPCAVGIHMVTAFIYNALPARPFWNASILAPRFLASAFCSGPALIIMVFQLVRKVTSFKIQDEALFKLVEIITVAMGMNLFLLGAELFKEYYSGTTHLASTRYLFQGLHGYNSLVPWIWTAIVLNVIAFIIFLIPQTRKKFLTINIACVMIFIGIWIEKGMGLIIPGFIPGDLGEIWEYIPTITEILVTVGIWATGLLIYSVILKVAIPIETGEFRLENKRNREFSERSEGKGRY